MSKMKKFEIEGSTANFVGEMNEEQYKT